MPKEYTTEQKFGLMSSPPKGGYMKKTISILLIILLIFSVTACGSSQDDLYNSAVSELDISSTEEILPPAENNNNNEELSGDLTIKMYRWRGSPPPIYFLAQEFMDIYPNVTINFDYDIDWIDNSKLSEEEKAQRENNYAMRLRAELLSGEADYVLYDSFTLDCMNLHDFSKNGVFLDMSKYWENDPEINSNEYFSEVLEAFKVDGKLTTIPASFFALGFYLNNNIMSEIGVETNDIITVNSNQLLDWYETAKEIYPELNLFFGGVNKTNLFELEYPSYIDLVSKTSNFDSSEFIDFLNRSKAVLNDEPELDEKREKGISYGGLANRILHYQDTKEEPITAYYEDQSKNTERNIITKSKNALATLEMLDIAKLSNFDDSFEYMAGPFAVSGSNERLLLCSNEDFTVPSSCKNPELAWEFIKHCIKARDDIVFTSEQNNSIYYTVNIPINISNFKLMGDNIGDFTKSYLGYEELKSVNVDEITEKLLEALKFNPINVRQYSLDVSDILDEFYIKELITAEECAKRIQDRAEIWLNE